MYNTILQGFSLPKAHRSPDPQPKSYFNVFMMNLKYCHFDSCDKIVVHFFILLKTTLKNLDESVFLNTLRSMKKTNCYYWTFNYNPRQAVFNWAYFSVFHHLHRDLEWKYFMYVGKKCFIVILATTSWINDSCEEYDQYLLLVKLDILNIYW